MPPSESARRLDAPRAARAARAAAWLVAAPAAHSTGAVCAACAIALAAPAPAAAFGVVATSPAQYALAVPPSVFAISAVFDTLPVVPPAAAVRVAGSMSGLHAGGLEQSGDSLKFYNLSGDFFPGETVHVNYRRDVVSVAGDSLAGGFYFSFTIASGAAPATWSPRYGYGAADIPYFVYGGDLDNDGDPDLAVPNEGSNAVSSFLNTNGAGYFPSHVEYGVGAVPSSCYGDDLDNDGDQDVATADITSGTVTVLLNNGDGSFAPRDTMAVGAQCRQVYGGDFDGDNDIDLCATLFHGPGGTNGVYLFTNDGAGLFASSPLYTDVKPGAFAVETADVNKDGHIDIGVGCQDADSLVVLMNDGTGAFTTTGVYRALDGPWDLAGNDMDGDGDFDFVGVAANASRIVVMYNDGDGAFPTRSSQPTGSFPLGAFTADLDGDGDIDAMSSNFGAGTVGVYENGGLGVLALDATLAMRRSGSYTWAHDLDGDGDLDLSVVDELADSLFVFYNGTSPIVGVEPGGDGVGSGTDAAGATVARLDAWPNPARAESGAQLRLAGIDGPVAVDLFAVDGRLVRRVWSGVAVGGRADLRWDGRDARGRLVPAGRYVATATSSAAQVSRGIQVVR
jgi:hypothetical protein